MKARTLARLLVVAGILFSFRVAVSASFPPPELIGEWQGEGDIVVTWCQQQTLPIHLFIRADRKVSGTVGDASITVGSVRKNNWFLVWLGNPEYVVEARLDGPLVAAEAIQRVSIELVVDVNGHQLEGGFHTSGTPAGGKDSMSMAGTAVVLSRIQRLNTDIGQIRFRKLIGEERVGHRDLCRACLGEENPFAQCAEHHDKTEIDGQIG